MTTFESRRSVPTTATNEILQRDGLEDFSFNSALDIGRALERLEINDMALSSIESAIEIWPSDFYREGKALKNGLDSLANWSEITETAQARARANLGLSNDAGLMDIVEARRELIDTVKRAALADSPEAVEALDKSNPEVAWAMKVAAKQLREAARKLEE